MGRPRKTAMDDWEKELRNSIDGSKLNAYIERIENVNAEIADLTSDRRELYAEIKAAGYDTATVLSIVKGRAMDANKKRARDELLAEYMAALGDLADTPLGQAGADRMRKAAE